MGFIKKKEIQVDYLSLKDTVIEHIGDTRITPANILNIITICMNTVEKLGDGTGTDKKQLCMTIIYDIINNTETILDKDFLIIILNNIFDPFIENIISVSKGTFDINKGLKLFDFGKIIKIFTACCKQQKMD